MAKAPARMTKAELIAENQRLAAKIERIRTAAVNARKAKESVGESLHGLLEEIARG